MLMVQGCLQLISGRVSDIIGRRKMAVAGTTGMVLFNVLTAFMPVREGVTSGAWWVRLHLKANKGRTWLPYV